MQTAFCSQIVINVKRRTSEKYIAFWIKAKTFRKETLSRISKHMTPPTAILPKPQLNFSANKWTTFAALRRTSSSSSTNIESKICQTLSSSSSATKWTALSNSRECQTLSRRHWPSWATQPAYRHHPERDFCTCARIAATWRMTSTPIAATEAEKNKLRKSAARGANKTG